MTYKDASSSGPFGDLNPVLRPGAYFFCTTKDDVIARLASAVSLATFKEDEGTSLVLGTADAIAFGFGLTLPMSRIVLEVYSALDGVGLTAAVAGALAADGIACNMIAAFHHDNVFVPEAMADRALAILADLQRTATTGDDAAASLTPTSIGDVSDLAKPRCSPT